MKPIIYGILALILASAAYWFSDYCFMEGRKLHEDELIHIAILNNLKLHAYNTERTKFYENAQDVIDKNPGCCKIINGGDHLIGLKTVQIKYKIKSNSDDTYDSYIVINACGKIVRTYGTIIGK